MGFLSGGARASRSAILEVWDGLSVLPMAEGSIDNVFIRNGVLSANGTIVQKFWNGGVGTTAIAKLANGFGAQKITGGGGGGFSGKSAIQLSIPIYQLRNTAPNLPADLYRQLEYRYSVTAWRGDPTNDGTFSVALKDAGGTILGAFHYKGVGLEVVGAGDWRAIQKNNAGAVPLTQDVATGKSSTTPRQIEFIYVSGLNPKLSIEIDGDEVLSVVGDANMPTSNSAGSLAAYLSVISEGTTATKFDYVTQAKYVVSEA